MKIIYTDVLVIGGGLAGLRMAVAAKRRGHDSDRPFPRSAEAQPLQGRSGRYAGIARQRDQRLGRQ